ncbi:SWF/SNF family helicase [Minicystis rosea]|nr:SWF/SNF family helicase [Minicystis rosea]
MNRPRGPGGRNGSGLDPKTAARLRDLLDATAPPTEVRRPPPPPATRIELTYVLELEGTGEERRPVLAVWQRRIPPDARPEPWEPAPVTAKIVDRWPMGDDRALLRAIVDASTNTASLRIGGDEGPRSSFALSRAASARLLPMLGRSGRFRLHRRHEGRPLVYQETPWAFRLRVTVVTPDPAAPPVWDVEGVLRSGATEIPLAAVDYLLDGGFVIVGERLARIDDGGATSWVGMLRMHKRMRIPETRRTTFLEELYATVDPPIDLPDGIAIDQIAAPPTPRLLVHPPSPNAPSAPLFAELSFLYDGAVIPSRRPGRLAFDAARSAIVRRDPEAENKARARLEALGVEPLPKGPAAAPPEGAHLAIAPPRLAGIVSTLTEEGFRVEAAAGKTYRAARDFKMRIASGVDWFDLEGDVDFDGRHVALPDVLEALRRGDKSVLLDDGSIGLLPEEWLGRHGLVLRLGAAQRDRVRFTRSQLPLLTALTQADPRVRADDAFVATHAPLVIEGAVEPLDPPEGFRGSLRAYQREGLGWLTAVGRSGLGGLLADDMGLGKTVQLLALLAGQRGRPSLVVAPRSLVFNWKREAAQFTPGLRVLDHTGGDRKPPSAHFNDYDLVLTTYGTLRRDADALADIDFGYVVLDEAQAIKNDGSDTSRAARRLRAERRVALSGTPVENHLGELWSIVEFLNPGMLGRASAWKAATDARPSPDAVALLGRALRPILLRRTKAEVARDLPARMDETWICELDAPARALYDELRARFRDELLHKVRADGMASAGTRVLEALLRLRQAACHPGLLDPERKSERSAKLATLIPELIALRESGQKALVFSQFRSLLDLVRPALEAEGITCAQLDGSTRDREGLVARFQNDPSLGVLLVSLKAGGVGLNLTAAEYVFLLDPWWNPAAEAQAIDRAHRIGQTKPVFAYRLIAKDTVEERIAELQQQKRALAESVIRGDGAPLRELSVDDLERLLS